MEQQQKIEIGQRVKWLRNNSAETSRSIAAYCGVSVEAVRNWIAGKGIAYDNAEKVAEMFELDVNWVWRGQGEGPSAPDLNAILSSNEPTSDGDRLDDIDRKLDTIIRDLTDEDAESTEGDDPLPDPGPLGPSRPPTAPSKDAPPSRREERRRRGE